MGCYGRSGKGLGGKQQSDKSLMLIIGKQYVALYYKGMGIIGSKMKP